MDLKDLAHEHFAKHLNETFCIRWGSEQIDLELIEATQLKRRRSKGREPFSIVFRGPIDRFLSQHMYLLEHDGMGILEIFLVPIGPDETGMCYEAIFN